MSVRRCHYAKAEEEGLRSMIQNNKQVTPYSTFNCTDDNLFVVRNVKWSKIQDAGLVIEKLRARIPAGTAGDCSSPELTLCVDCYSVSVPPPCYLSGT